MFEDQQTVHGSEDYLFDVSSPQTDRQVQLFPNLFPASSSVETDQPILKFIFKRPKISKVSLKKNEVGEGARRRWRPTPVFFLGNPMGSGAQRAIVLEATKCWTRLRLLSTKLEDLYYLISRHYMSTLIMTYPGEGKGYPLQHSGLENSMDYTVHGVTSQIRLSDFHFTYRDIHMLVS